MISDLIKINLLMFDSVFQLLFNSPVEYSVNASFNKYFDVIYGF